MIISGKELSARMKAEMAEQVAAFPARFGRVPCLAVILVGEDPASQSYVKGKAKAEAEGQWIESEEARKMLGVSAKTWQTYRDSRAIPFSQFGRKIYVKKADIEAFLQAVVAKCAY